MDYFTLLQLKREPFSNAPDPDLFFPSFAHHDCMQKMELAIRLRRGLNVVVGDVGTGKTTLCRTLIRRLAEDKKIHSHLFLDPAFASAGEFLSALLSAFTGTVQDARSDENMLKEQIKNFLFHACVENEEIHLVILDEGQKLPGFALEILRELLNYETNEHKLLQIVIFAQPEFEQLLETRENFKDRVNLFYRLGPLSFRETVGLIRFRIIRASDGRSAVSFTPLAMWRIYRLSRGYPRKIIHLCHQVLLALIIQDRTRVTSGLVNVSAHRTTREVLAQRPPAAPLVAGILVGLVLIAGGLFLLPQGRGGKETVSFAAVESSEKRQQKTALVRETAVPAAAVLTVDSTPETGPATTAPLSADATTPVLSDETATVSQAAPVKLPRKIKRPRLSKILVIKPQAEKQADGVPGVISAVERPDDVALPGDKPVE
ncbi:MAG: AAA family ATPase [Thermodesulfobacteriota bacterium]|nr:AAA family ATPase [Thermodesulfobacteriota bacterium]